MVRVEVVGITEAGEDVLLLVGLVGEEKDNN